MASYNLDFAKQMSRAADLLASDGEIDFDKAQAIAYMSLVSIEVAMKAILEKAGWDTDYLRRRSHNLHDLLVDMCNTCLVKEMAPGHPMRIRASEICALPVKDHNGAKGTVGSVIDAESRGASKYPNGLRYGDKFSHYSPTVLTQASKQVIAFADKYWDTFEKPEQNGT